MRVNADTGHMKHPAAGQQEVAVAAASSHESQLRQLHVFHSSRLHACGATSSQGFTFDVLERWKLKA
jgi:hypothetical protein